MSYTCTEWERAALPRYLRERAEDLAASHPDGPGEPVTAAAPSAIREGR